MKRRQPSKPVLTDPTKAKYPLSILPHLRRYYGGNELFPYNHVNNKVQYPHTKCLSFEVQATSCFYLVYGASPV